MGLPGYMYLVQAGQGHDAWQKVGVAATVRRVRQHRGWMPLGDTFGKGFRLADPRGDGEQPLLSQVYGPNKRPSRREPRCSMCGAEMPELPSAGHTEAWHMQCYGAQNQLFEELLETFRTTHGYPDHSTSTFSDGTLEPGTVGSSNGKLVHVGEYPHPPNAKDYTHHAAATFFIKTVPAAQVLRWLEETVIRPDNLMEMNLLKKLITEFDPHVRRQDGGPLKKPSGSGGITTVKEVQRRLNQMAREPFVTVAFVNDRTTGMLHAFAHPEIELDGPY